MTELQMAELINILVKMLGMLGIIAFLKCVELVIRVGKK